MYMFTFKDNNYRSVIFNALTQKLKIQPDKLNEFRLTRTLGESVHLDETFKFQINRTNFSKV